MEIMSKILRKIVRKKELLERILNRWEKKQNRFRPIHNDYNTDIISYLRDYKTLIYITGMGGWERKGRGRYSKV